jgi:hypothetical protein
MTAATDRLVRAAVLSVFDIDWLEPGLAEADAAEADRLAGFLADSCERVVDSDGVTRWRLRDDERLRVLRTVPRPELLAAIEAAPQRPDEPVQQVLEHYLYGTLRPVESLGPAELAGVLQVERWLGPRSDLPSPLDIEGHLDWLNLLAPLRRLLARGFVGRNDVVAALWDHTRAPASPPFIVEGVGGSGKSAVLARLIESVTAVGDLACYASLDRSWLVQGGSWSLLDEITRQVGMQSPGASEQVTGIRQQVQRFARRTGYSDVASRTRQEEESIPPELLEDLARLVSGRRLVLVLDTLEELARRDDSLVSAYSLVLSRLTEVLPGLRVIAAGRARPRFSFPAGRVYRLAGLPMADGVHLLRMLAEVEDEPLLRRIVLATHGNPLSLHLAADVLRRTGNDPTRLLALGEGDIQGQLYSRLLEHIRDPRARAVAHPGLVVRRITPEVIRDVLAEPCRIAPLSESDATQIFWALSDEATLCEPSADGDGALVHRTDVRALMLPAITRARPGTARAIHEAAVHYYERGAPPSGTTDHVARREELYHRLMLKQRPEELNGRWIPAVAEELAVAIDELPAEAQLYLAGRVKGLHLDPDVRAEAGDHEWRHATRPAVESLLERGQTAQALELTRERRGADGRALLPDLEIEALERLGRLQEALDLAAGEQRRASRLGHDAGVRDLILQQARILERLLRFDEAWTLLHRLTELDRVARARGGVPDDEVCVRELVVLTSLLRVGRHSGRDDEDYAALRAKTAGLAEATSARVLSRSPSLLRDLAAEIGDLSPRILEIASTVRGVDTKQPGTVGPVEREVFIADSDGSQGYRF